MPLNYGEQEWVSVVLSTGAKYVYKTNVPDSIYNELGITAFNPSVEQTNCIFEANSPRPPRATKLRTTTGIDGSYISSDKIAAARTAGWKFQKPKLRRRIYPTSANKRVVTVYVTVGGIKYAWDMNASQKTLLAADLAGLGIEEATAADIPNLVFGASVPRPARVRKEVDNAGNIDTYTTFCSQNKEDSLPSGWSLALPHILFGPNYL